MIGWDPPTLDPTRATDNASGQIIEQLFSGLVSLNQELDVIPELAQSWEMLGGGEEWVFHLREDARWSDGHPVTAGDFVYAWRRILNPAFGSGVASYLYDIKGARAYHQGQLSGPEKIGVQAPDPSTLLVKLEGPTGYFPLLLAQVMLYPVPRHAVEAHGENWTQLEHMVTNGPFRLECWEPGHSMILTRNPDYPGEFTGNVERVTLILNKDKAADQTALYEADHLDLAYLWPSPEGDRLRQRHAGEYFSGPSLYTQYIGFNVNQPPFGDPRVRRALAMATDKETLASETLAGYDFPATGGLIPPEMSGHSPGIGLPYDPERARALLAEAGYPDGRGFPEVQGMTNPGHKKLACDALRIQWRHNLGIDIVWQSLEWSHLLERLYQEPPPLFAVGWGADYPDPDNALRMSTHSQWTGWHNPTYEQLLEEAKYIADREKRMALYQQADGILIEDAAIVPIYYGRNHMLIKPWVHKLSLSVMNWYLWKDVIIEPH
jgi:oligopeptide transport system substrate-binding protein